MGHVGLTPQSYRKFGGFKVQGREADSAREIRRRREGARAGRLLRDRPRVRARVARGGDHAGDRDSDARHRRGRRLRRPGAGVPRRRGPDRATCGRSSSRRYADLAADHRGRRARSRQDVKSGAFPSEEESFTGGEAGAAARALIKHGPRRSAALREAVAQVAQAARPADRLRSDDGGAARGPPVARAPARARVRVRRRLDLRQPAPVRRRARTSRATRATRRATPRLLESEGADLLYLPDPERASIRRTSRPPSRSAGVSEGGEGARRPGHFRGVATVVAKLFLQVAAGRRRLRPQGPAAARRHPPDGARPGLPVRLVVGDTVRESGRPRDVLAQRVPLAGGARSARRLSRTLFAARARAGRGEPTRGRSRRMPRRQLEAAGLAVDYVEAVDAETMRRADRVVRAWRSPPRCGSGRRG